MTRREFADRLRATGLTDLEARFYSEDYPPREWPKILDWARECQRRPVEGEHWEGPVEEPVWDAGGL